MSMTLYDFNKQLYSQATPLTADTLRPIMTNIGDWFSKYNNVEGDCKRYFMLLNNDIHWFTVFNFVKRYYNKALEELYGIFANLGDIVGIEYNHESDYWEIWIRLAQSGDTVMFILFESSDFVIDIE